MTQYISKAGLKVHPHLNELLENEILPGLELDAEQIWQGFSKLLDDLTPVNRELLAKRDAIQEKIDAWHIENPGQVQNNFDQYKAFLMEIGYLVVDGPDFKISTQNVDAEIASIAGPQLVVPVNNARFSLNAANARWGSLYDAYYGTDVISEQDGCGKSGPYNEKRGQEVMVKAAEFLDVSIPLSGGISHVSVAEYLIVSGSPAQLSAKLIDGTIVPLSSPDKFVGYKQSDGEQCLLCKNNNLHIEIYIDREHLVGRGNPSGVKDVVLESAVSTIQDCEDSVAAVDADDKVLVYRNWLGLMKGDLEESFEKGGRQLSRKLNADRSYTSVDGGELTLHGRSLLLVRNVGHLMTNDAILDSNGDEVPEGFMDALFTTLCAMHDFNKDNPIHNSRTGSVYIVKPKMHGPEEVALTDRLFSAIEDMLALPRNTMKVGVMDEERRTTINLNECIRTVKDRLVFINTGFLDRTGDEIHTSMMAGPMLPKEAIKQQAWINAYENWNVDVGLDAGLTGKAQIGKGMWAKPDEMQQMLDTKLDQLNAGANCAWVPSPTAATLHATHYHAVDVFAVQAQLGLRPKASLDDILTPPLLGEQRLSDQEIQQELDNNAQGILGYVVRWIDQGVGCSKVPDIHDVGLMEDRATLRISSQHMANWLHHGICSEAQVMETMKRMAGIVDEQNANDPAYVRMSSDFEGIAFKSACALVFKGCVQPNGYTEPLLHAYRKQAKAQKQA